MGRLCFLPYFFLNKPKVIIIVLLPNACSKIQVRKPQKVESVHLDAAFLVGETFSHPRSDLDNDGNVKSTGNAAS